MAESIASVADNTLTKIKKMAKACAFLLLIFSLMAIALLMTFPVTSLPISEHNPISYAKDALVGEWGNDCCGTYAILPDGREIGKIRVNNQIKMWTLASIVRLNLTSPYYIKHGAHICRIVYTRASWLEPFIQSCVPVQQTDLIMRAFAEGRMQLVTRAKEVRVLYERYRNAGLVE